MGASTRVVLIIICDNNFERINELKVHKKIKCWSHNLLCGKCKNRFGIKEEVADM